MMRARPPVRCLPIAHLCLCETEQSDSVMLATLPMVCSQMSARNTSAKVGGGMSERNGDRARFQKNRKRKLHHRQRIQAFLADYLQPWLVSIKCLSRLPSSGGNRDIQVSSISPTSSSCGRVMLP